jgi:hypothetical protein
VEEQRLVVRPHDPRRVRLLLAAGAVVALLVGYGVFYWGHHAGGGAGSRAERQAAELGVRTAQLEAELEVLRDELSRARTTLEVDRQAQEELRTALAESEARVASLNEELQFYRRIVVPPEGRAGLRVQTFEVVPGDLAGGYRLHLLLVQNPQRSGRASGLVEVDLHGTLAGEAATLALPQLAAEPQPYEFLYFQDVDVEVILPAGFEPETVDVGLKPTGRRSRAIVASFPWEPSS